MGTIRYAREELLRWKDEAEEGGLWDVMVTSMGAPLYQELCSLSQIPDYKIRTSTDSHRNMDKRYRVPPAPPQYTNNPPDKFLDRGQVLNVEEEGEVEVEDEDDSDDEVSLQPRAFQVYGEPCWDSGPPQDGFEYLRRVIWETARCPKVKVAKISDKKLSKQTNYMPEIQPIPVCPVDLLPSNDWVREFLKDFSHLRTALSKISNVLPLGGKELPPIQDKSCWKNVCFGSSNKKLLGRWRGEGRSVYDKHKNAEIFLSLENQEDGDVSSSFEKHEHGESLSVEQQHEEGKDSCIEKQEGRNILSQEKHDDEESSSTDEDEILKANGHGDIPRVSPTRHGHETPKDSKGGCDDSGAVLCSPLLKTVLRLDEVSRAILFQHHVSWLKEKGDLTYGSAIWLFALSAVVDTPLDDLTCAAFRELLRICAELRRKKSADNDELYMLNILITIAGEYFGQADRFTEMGTNA